MRYKALVASLFALIILQACSKDDTANNPSGINKTANKQITGSSANDILSDSKFKSIVVELAYVEGYEPTANAVAYFEDFINTTSHKPEGITIIKKSIPSLGDTEYTIEELADIEEANRTQYNTDDEIAIWAFFTAGKSDKDGDETVGLGTAYGNACFVILEETLRGFNNGPFEPDRSLLEATVIKHEFGH